MSDTPFNSSGQQRRAFWLRHLRQWHWVSSALCIVAMLMFAATGITLNHASQIEAHGQVRNKKGQLPPALLAQLNGKHGPQEALPAAVRAWLQQQWQIETGTQVAEWSEQEVYMAMPRPGGDAWLRVDLESGELEYETTERGWVAYFNDLHKGRNTGPAWTWFIDIFAISCLVFCITGLFLLQLHAGNRPITWPLAGLGLVVPLLLLLVFIH
jgi:hypothetical protein